MKGGVEMKRKDHYQVPLEKLKKVCDIDDELRACLESEHVSQLDAIAGQERAVKSMEFGLDMEEEGYHIFVAGAPGTGKSEYTKAVVSRAAAGRPVPNDWCYLYNFRDKDKPLAVSLPAGKGRAFQLDMEKLVYEMKTAMRKAFESTDYELKKDSIFSAFQKKMEELVQVIGKKSYDDGFGVKPMGMKFVFIPLKDGRPMQPDEYNLLTEEERNIINEKRHELLKKLDETLTEGQLSERKMTNQLFDLSRETAQNSAEPLINQLKEKYLEIPKILEYLEEILLDIAERSNLFIKAEMSSPTPSGSQTNGHTDKPGERQTEQNNMNGQDDLNPYNRYRVNLFVNNEDLQGAPIIEELNPYYYNLFGKIEYKTQYYVMNTDYTLVKPGAVHLANGGYLILQARDILTDPFAWNALKKIIKNRQAVVENIGEQYRTVPTVTLRPEPIPMNFKVILIGSPIYYYILSSDEDFRDLFKIKVDFDYEMPRTPENIRKYVSFVSAICQEKGFDCFTPSGMAEIVEYGSRMADSQKKLSTRFEDVREVVYEAISWAKKDGASQVDRQHVKTAICERKYRFNRMEEKIKEEIIQKRIIIDTKGSAIGQINGLFIMQTGVYAFGLPSRITAITHVGRGGVMNIERETEMSGSIHSKGVFTLAGYLGGKFAQNRPIGFTAQVTFEQLYDGVEGDSASSAELYAIISSLADIPITQSLAVTGSVDQLGDIQPIGGVNEKIEGYFDVCSVMGLTGKQGVMIPQSNVDNLMLKDEVLEAVKNKQFHIYAVKHIEEGLEILTGKPAGKIDAEGNYPEDSIFGRVNQKLADFARALEPGGNGEEVYLVESELG